jgi:hypothetical protein
LLLVAAVVVPGNISASSVDVTVGHTTVKLDETADCSKDGTCDTGDLYSGEKEEDEGDGYYEDEDEEECFDNNEKCDRWASLGECEANAGYMLKNCKKSCMICGDV